MRTWRDEDLMAYADGELGDEQRRAIADAARADPALARRIAAFAASRRLLQETLDAKLREPVPQRLLDVLAAPVRAEVVPPRRRAARWMPLALAASLALAIGIGAGGWWFGSPPLVSGLPPETAALGRALETLASGVPAQGESRGVRYEILPLSTLRRSDGTYCREFESSLQGGDRRVARGLACREGGAWTVQAVATVSDAAPAPGGYRAASGGAIDFAAALGTAQRLTPDEERKRLDTQWR